MLAEREREGSPSDRAVQSLEATPLDAAIWKTVCYAALFECALSGERLHRMLWDVRTTRREIDERLCAPYLAARLAITAGCIHPRGAEAWLALRPWREARSRALVARHRRALEAVAALPFVRLIALTGGCAHDNAADDDLDVFLVARRGRAWILSLAVILLSRLLRCRRTLCVNYVVDEDGARLPERDAFTAAELAGLRPWAGAAGYRALLEANPWVAEHLPNFLEEASRDNQPLRAVRCPRWVERILDLGPAQIAEAAARAILGAHFRRKWPPPHPGVTLTSSRLKLHPIDHAPDVRARFQQALQQEGIA
jgi:hypothetical protein